MRKNMTPALGMWRAYTLAFGAWLMGLVALVFTQAALVRLPDVPTWSGTEVLWHLATAAGALMPFVAFAGGAVAAPFEPLGRRRLVELAGIVGAVALVAYMLPAVAVPNLRYAYDSERGINVAETFPFGPRTPAALLRQRARIVANLPTTYSRSIEQPLAWPPNWVDYLLNREIAWATFAIINSFLGLLVGRALARDGPRRRRRALWSAGLASGMLFLIVATFCRNVVRDSLTISGVAMAWLPLVLPMAAIAWLSLGPARPALVHERPVAGEKAEV